MRRILVTGTRAEHETPYIETELLLAVMNDNEEQIGELIDKMSKTERIRFGKQLERCRDHVLAPR